MRAIACIALVSYHVVGSTPASGMELPLDHWLVLLNGTFGDMRMPLFSFLSGCVFVSLEALTRGAGWMVLSKMRRLLLPLLSVGALFWLANLGTGRTVPPLASLLYMPYAHFWFLQATFVIVTCFLLLHVIWPQRSTTLAACLMAFSTVIWVSGLRLDHNIFSLNHVAYLMPFFMLGYLCAHSRGLAAIKTHISPISAAFAILALTGVGFALVSGRLVTSSLEERHALTLLIGAGFCLSLMVLAPRNAKLARLGGYSYTIYLFHVFFTAGSFECLSRAAPGLPDALVWTLGILMGLLGPVVIHHAVMRSSALATLLLGLKPRIRRLATPRPVAQTPLAQRA